MTQRMEKVPRASTPPPGAESRASLLTSHDLYLFNEGTHYRLYDKLGAHPITVNGVAGTYLAV